MSHRALIAGLLAAVILSAVAVWGPSVLPGSQPVLFLEDLAVGVGSAGTVYLFIRERGGHGGRY